MGPVGRNELQPHSPVLAFEYAYVLYRLNKTGPAREVLATVPETEDTRESLRHLRAQIVRLRAVPRRVARFLTLFFGPRLRVSAKFIGGGIFPEELQQKHWPGLQPRRTE